MNINANFEHRAGSSQDKHEGESSFALCDRLGRTRDNSQRQLPTDHDYAVPTREYQTDQSSIKTAPAAARSVLEKTQRQLQKPHRFRSVDRVTPYQAHALTEVAYFGQGQRQYPSVLLSSAILRAFPIDFHDLNQVDDRRSVNPNETSRVPPLTQAADSFTQLGNAGRHTSYRDRNLSKVCP